MKQNLTLKVFLLTLVSVFTTSCKEHHDWVDSEGVKVTLSINWSEANLQPNGSTICIYDQVNENTPIFIKTNGISESLYLPPSTYSIIVFNETTDSHSGIQFSGMEHFETAQALIDGTPDMLAAASMADLEITRDMLRNYEEPEYTLTPQRLSIPVEVGFYIQGLYNVSVSRPSTAEISGMATGIQLGTCQAIHTPVHMTCELSDHVYDPSSTTNGMLQGQMYCFGLVDPALTKRDIDEPDTPWDITVKIPLRNGGELPPVNRRFGRLTDLENGSDLADENGNSGNGGIIIPYVNDAEGGNSGFDAGVGDWGDNTDVPVTTK